MASLAVCASREQAEAQFEELVQFVQQAIQFMPSFRWPFQCDILNTRLYCIEKGYVVELLYCTFSLGWRSRGWPIATKVTLDGLVLKILAF